MSHFAKKAPTGAKVGGAPADNGDKQQSVSSTPVQVTLNQVVVQLSSSARVGGDAPVFSVSNAPAGTAGINQVQLSAAARAMAEVSSTGTRPQLAMFVQLVGSLGPGAAKSFVPSAPAVVAAERFQPMPADLGQQARAEAAEDARQIDAERDATAAAALQDVPTTTPDVGATVPAAPVSAVVASAPVAAYLQAAAPVAAPSGPAVDVSA